MHGELSTAFRNYGNVICSGKSSRAEVAFVVRSSWLTGTRTRRLLDVLAALPGGASGIPTDEARLRIWRLCDGPIDEVPVLLDVLVGAELVRVELGQYKRTPSGHRAIARRGPEGLRPVGLALLRAGYFHDQARALLDLGTNDADGNLTCPTRQARRACPIRHTGSSVRHGSGFASQ